VLQFSDNELSLWNVLFERVGNYQTCVRHCVGDVRFYLWSAGLPREKRKEAAGKLVAVLGVLHRSVSKHVVDGDFEKLELRIEWVLRELEVLSEGLFLDGLDVVARFVRNWANYMVTFARLAMSGVSVPCFLVE